MKSCFKTKNCGKRKAENIVIDAENIVIDQKKIRKIDT